MIPELGNFALILAFFLSVILGVIPMAGAAGAPVRVGTMPPPTWVFLPVRWDGNRHPPRQHVHGPQAEAEIPSPSIRPA